MGRKETQCRRPFQSLPRVTRSSGGHAPQSDFDRSRSRAGCSARTVAAPPIVDLNVISLHLNFQLFPLRLCRWLHRSSTQEVALWVGQNGQWNAPLVWMTPSDFLSSVPSELNSRSVGLSSRPDKACPTKDNDIRANCRAEFPLPAC